jgi:hypothetical protein
MLKLAILKRPLLEKLVAAQLVKKFQAIHAILKFITLFRRGQWPLF